MRVKAAKSLSSFLLCGMLGLPAFGLGGEVQDKPGNTNKQQQSSPTNDDSAARTDNDSANSDTDQQKIRKLRVFELQHRTPTQLTQVITMAEQASHRAHRATGQTFPVGTARVPARAGVGQPGSSEDRLATAADDQKKLLFVRGSEDQIQTIGNLVDALDIEDQKLQRHDFQGVTLIPVSSSSAPQVYAILTQLQLPGQMLRIGEMSLIAFHGEDANKETVEQAEQVINQLSPAQPKQKKDESEERKEDSDKK